MTYEQAIQKANETGAANAEGLPLLAITMATLSLIHAINPSLAYYGALRRGLTSRQVMKLNPIHLSNLMFEE